MTGPKILFLSRSDVERAGPAMDEVIRAVEAMFREKGEGRTEMPPKTAIHPRPEGFLNAMPAFLPKSNAAGIKWVGSYPGNIARGLPSITGLIVLNDSETGVPICVMDGTWITAQRTGAATAVAAKFLARQEAETVGLLGCGVQGYSNIEALSRLFGVKRIKAFDLRPEASAAYARRVGDTLGLRVEVVGTPAAAVRGSDIVVTAGAIRRDLPATVEAAWFEEGAFASAVDYDSAWTQGALAAVDVFATDDVAQMEYYRDRGEHFLHVPAGVVELGDIVAGKTPGRSAARERTMAMNLGIALDDMAVAPLILAKARAAGLGVELEP
jgi:ornithine cyclodeaminase/alanine dehydrogenase